MKNSPYVGDLNFLTTQMFNRLLEVTGSGEWRKVGVHVRLVWTHTVITYYLNVGPVAVISGCKRETCREIGFYSFISLSKSLSLS